MPTKKDLETEDEGSAFVESDLSLERMKEMVLIDCTFLMGALDDDEDADYQYGDEMPLHEVRLTRRISIGRYQVTQALWENVMGSNPSKFKGNSRPVEEVTWKEAFQSRSFDLQSQNLDYASK
jgi:formylglycine-generating enzyme required for sulfatase activity